MSIQYAGGTIVNTTFLGDTRGNIALNVKNQLVNAGWTLIRTNTTNDFVVASATTPQGLSWRVRIYDPGSGVSCRFKAMNIAETKVQSGDCFLASAGDKTYRIIANRYQFFVLGPNLNVSGEYIAGGVPYLPAFLTGVITEAFWLHSSSTTDNDTAFRNSFRSRLNLTPHQSFTNVGNLYTICNGNVAENNNNYGGNIGMLRLVGMGTSFYTEYNSAYRWHDDSSMLYEPLIAWGISSNFGDEAKIRGQLWDSFITSDAWTADTTITVDGHNFLAITHSNAGTTTQSPGTLFVATS